MGLLFERQFIHKTVPGAMQDTSWPWSVWSLLVLEGPCLLSWSAAAFLRGHWELPFLTLERLVPESWAWEREAGAGRLPGGPAGNWCWMFGTSRPLLSPHSPVFISVVPSPP